MYMLSFQRFLSIIKLLSFNTSKTMAKGKNAKKEVKKPKQKKNKKK